MKPHFTENMVIPNFIREYAQNYLCIVANAISIYPDSYAQYESDILAMNKNRMVFEFEIKLSVNDFRHDFKKSFHTKRPARIERTKQSAIFNGELSNYFTYVMPTDVYEKVQDEIPDKAGVMVFREGKGITPYLYFTRIKRPKLLHQRKANDDFVFNMLNKMQLRYNNMIYKRLSEIANYMDI